jgi:hypothetical protein
MTVVAAGATIPEGTKLWSLDDPPTATTPKHADVLRASWVDSVDPEDQPGLFFVDEGTEWGATTWGAELMRLDNRPTRIRAVTLDGRELWEHAFTGRRVRHVAADQFGGVVLVRESGSDSPTAAWQPDSITALDGQTGQPRWTYFAREDYSHFTEAAIHPDGTVYVVERGDKNASRLWAFHGQTGAAQGRDLASGQATVWVDGVLKSDGPVAATIAWPIVREDGAVVLVSRRHTSEGAFRSVGSVNQLISGSYDVDVSEIELAEGASAPSVHPVGTAAYADERLIPGSMDDYRLLPDGAGGVLLGHHHGIDVLRVDPSLTLSARVPLEPLTNSRRPYEAEYVLGDDGAYALINGYDTATYPAPTQYWSKVVGFNAATLAEEQDSPVGLPQTQPQHHRLLFATTGNGVHVTAPTFDNAVQLTPGTWAGWATTPSAGIGSAVALATSGYADQRGNPQRSNSTLRYESNRNAIELQTTATLETVFAVVIASFQGINAAPGGNVTVTGAPVTHMGQQLTFTLADWKGWLQPPFSVEVIRYDPTAHTIAAKTLPGHPLIGWRYWRAFRLAPDRIVIETGAVDTPFGGFAGRVAFEIARADQVAVWQRYLEYTVQQLPGSAAVIDSPDYDLDELEGKWNADKTYIMTHVCGAPPLPSGFCP